MGQSDLTAAARNYQQQLERGLRFQDYVADVLYNLGIPLVTSVSKARSMRSENKMGLEIKRDDKFRRTGNLYIETAEKSDPANATFVPSGIYREDNSWLYLIGDEQTFWIFAKSCLQLLERNADVERREIATSHGYLLPLAKADKWCARRIDCEFRSPEQDRAR